MRKTLNKIIAGAVALCMVASVGAVNAFAAAPYTDGAYTASAVFLHETKDQPSMCNALFDHDADVVVNGENTTISLYVANPVPAFAGQGADGTVKNVVLTLDGVQYTAESDMETKPLRQFDETNALFGLTAGQEQTAQVLNLTIPTAKLDMLATGIKTDAYVNVVMMTDVIFRLRLDNINRVGGEPAKPTETKEHAMAVTCDIAAPAPGYMVEIPESVALGTLSTEKDTVVGYTVDVTAENLGEGYVEITTDDRCLLQFEQNGIVVSNNFGTQKTSETASLAGEFSVRAVDVKASTPGNYTGTATFTISYFAAK